MLKTSKTYFIAFLTFILFFQIHHLSGQSTFGFKITNDRKKITIPFEEYNNLVVIPITINNSLTVKFIVDTGVQNPILTEKVLADLLLLKYERKISIAGPGVADSVTALITSKVRLSLPGGTIAANDRTLLVLEEDYLQLKNQMGVEVYGIIGYDLFSKFVVEIDYDKKEITFYDPRFFKRKKRGYRKIPLSIEKTKPYLQTDLFFYEKDSSSSVKLMIDSGASHGLLLDPEEDKTIIIPEKVVASDLGKGLGGDIKGKVGRVKEFGLSDYSFKRIIASFPDAGAYNKNIKRGSRSGTLGGELLSRLNPIFDYFDGQIYLQKGKRYRKPFEYDMSGMVISAFGPDLELVIVNKVIPDSPAGRAGIKKGDIIKRINGSKVESVQLSEMFNILRKKDRFKVKLIIVRNGTQMKKCFRLKRLI